MQQNSKSKKAATAGAAIVNSITNITHGSGKFMDKKVFTNDKALIDVIDMKLLNKQGNRCTKIAFNDYGNAFATSDTSGNILIFYITKGRYIRVVTDKHPSAMAFTEKEMGKIFLGLPNKTIEVYALDGKLITSLKSHQFAIHTLRPSHSRNCLLSCSWDCCTLWDLTTFKPMKNLLSQKSKFIAATFTPDGDSVVTAAQDGLIIFWSLSDFSIEDQTRFPKDVKITKLAVSQESRYLVAAGETPQFLVFDLKNRSDPVSYSLPGNSDSVRDIQFLPNYRLSLVASDGQMHIIDIITMRVIAKKGIPSKSIVQSSADYLGKFVLNLSNTGEIYFYNLQTVLEEANTQNMLKWKQGLSEDSVYSTIKPYLAERPDLSKSASLPGPSSFSGTNIDRILEESSEENKDPNQQLLPPNETVRSHQQSTQRFGQTKDKSSLFDSSVQDTHGSKMYRKSNKFTTSRTDRSMQQSFKISFANGTLDPDQLHKIVEVYSVFPEKHRALIWKFLLELPENLEAFDNIVAKGTHPAFAKLEENYMLKSHKLFAKLQRMCSCLAHYAPCFGEFPYLVDFIFPFVKLFSSDEVICFEIIISFFWQWAQHFLEHSPSPPSNYLQTIEQVLKDVDPSLAEHLNKCGFSAAGFFWSHYATLFTEFLSQDDWLSFFDRLMLNKQNPEYFLLFPVAYLTAYGTALKHLETAEGIEAFLMKPRNVNIAEIFKSIEKLAREVPGSAYRVTFRNNLPLTKGQYPIFTIGPKHSIDYYKKIKQQIAEEENRRMARYRQMKDLERLTNEIIEQETLFQKKQENLAQIERDRKELRAYEEEVRLARQLKAEKELREQRLNQIKQMEAGMKSRLNQSEDNRKFDKYDVERELEARQRIENQILQSRLEEEALLNLEFQAAKRLNEMIDIRNKEENAKSLTTDLEFKEKQKIMKERLFEEARRAEEEEKRLRDDFYRQKQVMQYALEQQEHEERQLRDRLAADDFEREMRYVELERKRKLRQMEDQAATYDEEFRELQKRQDKLLANEDTIQQKILLDEEKRNTLARLQQNLVTLEQERRKQMEEAEAYRQKVRKIEDEKKRKAFEDRIIEMSREFQQKLLDEEKKIQDQILQMHDQRARHVETQYKLAFQQQDYQDRLEFHRALKDRERQLVEEEQEKFEEFKNTVNAEFAQAAEVRQRLDEERMREITQQRENLLRQRREEVRKKVLYDQTLSSLDHEIQRNHGLTQEFGHSREPLSSGGFDRSERGHSRDDYLRDQNYDKNISGMSSHAGSGQKGHSRIRSPQQLPREDFESSNFGSPNIFFQTGSRSQLQSPEYTLSSKAGGGDLGSPDNYVYSSLENSNTKA